MVVGASRALVKWHWCWFGNYYLVGCGGSERCDVIGHSGIMDGICDCLAVVRMGTVGSCGLIWVTWNSELTGI